MREKPSQTYIVTGSNSGIGRVTAMALAARGDRVILACRSQAKTQGVVSEIKARGGDAEFAALDLADLESVRRFAAEIIAANRPIAALINNAGLASAFGKTKDGFELTFGTNHLGPYLLTRLLLDHLKSHAPARIVNVSSRAHYRTKQIPWQPCAIALLHEPDFPNTLFRSCAMCCSPRNSRAGLLAPVSLRTRFTRAWSRPRYGGTCRGHFAGSSNPS